MPKMSVCTECFTKREHDGKLFCPACRKRYGRQLRPMQTAHAVSTRTFINSRRWKTKRREILLRDGYKCQRHLWFGRVVYGKEFPVDHIVPRNEQPNLELSDRNLETLCPACHNTKTRLEQRGLVIRWQHRDNLFLFTGPSRIVEKVFAKQVRANDTVHRQVDADVIKSINQMHLSTERCFVFEPDTKHAYRLGERLRARLIHAFDYD